MCPSPALPLRDDAHPTLSIHTPPSAQSRAQMLLCGGRLGGPGGRGTQKAPWPSAHLGARALDLAMCGCCDTGDHPYTVSWVFSVHSLSNPRRKVLLYCLFCRCSNPAFTAQGQGSIPRWGTKVPQAMQSPKKQIPKRVSNFPKGTQPVKGRVGTWTRSIKR